MRWRRAAAVAILAPWTCLIAAVGWSAEAWRPPTATLLGGVNHVLVATLVESGSDESVHWSQREVINGEPPMRFSIANTGRLPAELVPGRDYLVAITTLRHHPLFREGLEMDPEGWRVTEIPGLGPAVFPDLGALRSLLQSVQEGAVDLPRCLTDVHALMRHQWGSVRRFALLELQLRPDLLALTDQETVEALRSVLDRPDTDWTEKQLALAIGRDLARPLAGTWLLEAARELSLEAPVDLDLATRRVALVETALEVLARDGEPADCALALRHLPSNSPGVVRRAGQAISILDCESGCVEAEALLERSGSLHVESRRALEALVARGCDGS